MKKIILNLTIAIIATLLCAAAVTTASSQDLDALAARGAILTDEDPMAVELRKGYRAQRGFDIGMAIAEGQTLPGPGKEAICASLDGREQGPCRGAVSFSVDRNKNADLVKRGAEIVKADPDAGTVRNAAGGVFYKLGFDIGLAISEGHTAEGPGKEKTCASLQLPAEQAGCRTAVSFSVERNRNNAALGASSGTTAGPPVKVASNEIRCRGGQNLIFTTENSKTSTMGEALIVSLLTFEPAASAAGVRGEGLRPGECAWADRAISGRFLIRFETSANAQLKQKLQGVPVDTSPTAAEAYPDARSIPIYMSDKSHYWSFFGTAPVNNFLTTTANGYWKPAVAIRDVTRSPTEPARRKGVLYPTKP